jgi:hypothetical protein
LSSFFSQLELRPVRQRGRIQYDQLAKNRIGFVWTGAFRIAAVSPSGTYMTLDTLEQGAAFGFTLALLGFHPTNRLQILADHAGTLLSLPAQAVLDAGRYNLDFKEALVRHLAYHLANAALRTYERRIHRGQFDRPQLTLPWAAVSPRRVRRCHDISANSGTKVSSNLAAVS